MNGSATTTPLARAITSLTTTANNKKGGGKATTTSISEALALSVADRICDNNKRKLIGGQSTITSAAATPNSPTPDNNNDTTTTTTAMNGTTRIKNRKIRVVSAEHSTKNNSATKSSPMKSSMSSAVADLASGMPNFNNSGGNNNSSGGNNAPIISGTAAAVLALQSPFHSSSHHVDSTLGGGGVAIVSNSSSLETTAGGGLIEGESSAAGNSNTTAVPNPLSILSEGAAATISSPTEDRTSLSLHSNSSNLSPQSVKSYADGAPIIAGTAAHAQMAAIATATAARITSIHLEGNGEEESSSSGLSPSGIHAVANLGNAPDRYIISGEQRTGDGGAGGGSNNTTTTRPHGFEVGQPPPTFGGRNGSCSVVKSTISMKSGGKNALFSVDHGRKQARVTPEDGHQPQCNASSSSRTIPPQSSNNDDDMPIITQTKAGGMDILAELTCHALPLALPQGSSTYTSSTSYNHPSYPQHHHNSSSSYNESSIPSYQEIYQEQGHTSQHHPQHEQQGRPRVSSIPSYQEIYQEMGIKPPPKHGPGYHQHQHQRHPHHAHHHCASSSYSVEEVQLNSSMSTNPYQQHYSQHEADHSSRQQQQGVRQTTHFGHILNNNHNRDELLEEGKELYTRKEIAQSGGHCAENKDVHGNMREGCDSLCLKESLDKDIREADGLLWFLYSCDRANGGGALCQSYHKKRPIRVFRSSLAGKPYGPPFLDVEDDLEDDSDVAYRYDGLYIVRAVWDMNGRETEAHPVIGENGWQTYFCTRVSKRPLEKEKREEGMHYNVIGCQELWSSIQSMRGVRRLKKFEIEIPPTKLSMIKKCAITGIYKDRKCPGYVKPIVEIPMETSTTTNAAKKPSRIKGGRKRRQQQEEEESDSDDEESENEENVSDSDSSEEVSSPVSKRSSSLSKTTPRPRMNSHKKSSPSSTHDDSSDSETSTSANITQKKKRVRSPSRKALLNNMDVSAYFPKRASAAKAEKANRDIVGSRTYKRKSSETTSASSKANNKQPIRAGGGGRKRAKANKRDEDEFSTSSEEGPDNSNMIDQSILTVGSRILVTYKDSLFKSTIRKRREKAGKHDFLIHYDGNKKTNVHWITVDKIQKILEINVDTPPKKKVATTKSRGNNGGGKRKAPSKQNSSASQESGSSSNTRPSLVRQQSLQQSHYQDKDGGSEDETDNDKKKSPRKKSKTEVAEPKVDVDDGDKSDEKKSATASSDKKKSASKDPRRKTSKTQKSKNSADRIVEESSSESEPDDPPPPTPKRKSNIKITTAADAVSRKPRKTVVSDVCIAQKHKPLAKTETASDDEADSDKSSTSSSEEESVESEPEEDFKYPVGSQVYTEYRRVFYSSTILKAKRKRSLTEYLVHYEGYKKSSNRWVKEKDLHEVNDATTRRYEEQRVAPTADSPHESDWVQESSMTTRRKKPVECDIDNSGRSSTTTRKKPPPRRMRSDQYDAALDALESGVAFLVGSMVFVEWSGALYLAKMLKKRYSGDRTEYMISYDGYRSSNDAWVSINKIYEVNPQTKRVFKLINAGTSGSSASDNKPKAIPKRRETRKKAHDDEAAAATSSTRNSERKQPTLSRATSTASSQSSRATSTIDMKGIEPGVEFLPGSTIFAEYKGGLCLAKMLKKRGKNDYMEYFIEYSGLKKALEVWISTNMVYEINPQTKRMFRQLQVKK